MAGNDALFEALAKKPQSSLTPQQLDALKKWRADKAAEASQRNAQSARESEAELLRREQAAHAAAPASRVNRNPNAFQPTPDKPKKKKKSAGSIRGKAAKDALLKELTGG